MPLQIVSSSTIQLVGKRLSVSLAAGRVQELWQSFMPIRSQIQHTVGQNLYSVEQYPALDFFETVDFDRTFTRWAAVEVTASHQLPDGLETLVIPEGRYAVFTYRGLESQARGAFQYIYGNWLPQSSYQLAHRPHFAKMDERYKGEDPTSEEEFWIPILS